MKERPILFSGPMVRAILDARKTQTRRPVKPQPFVATPIMFDISKCPFGQPGDRLWVRETWRPDYESDTNVAKVAYRAGGCTEYFEAKRDEQFWVAVILGSENHNWRPSIHMPRWASRITLEITRVWVERVQDITDQDAFNEGAPTTSGCLDDPCVMSFRQGFHDLWQSIYGTWDANPFVWAVEFRRLKFEFRRLK